MDIRPIGFIMPFTLEDANMEINAEDEGLTCKVSEGNLQTLSGPSVF